MNIIAVDIGSYSVKFLNTTLTKKSLKVVNYREILVEKVRKDFGTTEEEIELIDIQYAIIEQYLSQNLRDHKVIYNLSPNYTTARFLNLPVNNRKKANLMIPFQLDENIPHSNSEIHYTTSLFKNDESFKALINITQMSFFENIYNKLKTKHIIPNTLTTELSTIQSCLEEWGTEETVCLLDLGHSTTQAFFFNKNGVLSAHHSHIAGLSINQTIAQSYNISSPDAEIYKHQNCFFLTEDQFSNVDKDQQEFAKLMSKSFHPLIQDLKRWIMGIRVKENLIVERIFITGGTANINNIDHYISSELSTPVEFFDTGTLRQVDKAQRLSFNQASLMCTGFQSKKPLANFLTGIFSTSAKGDISLHSSVFFFTRTAILGLVLMITLLVERTFFLEPEAKNLDRINLKLLKNTALDIPPKTRKLYKKKTNRVLSYVKKKDKVIQQEIKTIQSATKVNALAPLIQLSSVMENNKLINLSHFENYGNRSKAIFESSKKLEIDLLSKHLGKSQLKEITITKKENKKTKKYELVLEFNGN